MAREREGTVGEKCLLLLPVGPSSGAQRAANDDQRRAQCRESCRRKEGLKLLGTRAVGVALFCLAFLGLVAIFVSVQERNAPRLTYPESHDLQQSPGTAKVEVSQDTSSEESVPKSFGSLYRAPKTTAGEAAVAAEEQRTGAAVGVGGRGRGKGKDVGVDPPSSTADNPNVFFIMIDDMGWNDIGYHSTDLANVTPNLDRLSASGVKVSQYYSMSICTPARAALMTGRYPVRYGLQYNVIQPGAPWGLPLTEKLLPEYMNEAGYESHMVGKWHLGSYTHAHTPHRRGFETYFGYLNDEEMYWTHQTWTATINGRKFFDFGFGNATGFYDVIERFDPPPGDDDSVSTGPTSSVYSSSSSLEIKGGYSTEIFTDRALEILSQKTPHDENPLFLYLSHQAVHDPLGVPPADAFSPEEWAVLTALEDESSDASLRVRFAKVLMYLDKSIGRLMDYLETEGWLENSIIVVTSDNGGCPSTGGSNYPLRGLKHSNWEGGVKVPAFVYSPSHIPEGHWGTEYRGLMHVTDWLPTLADAANFELLGSHGDLDGVSHWKHIVPAPDNDTTTASEPPEAATAVAAAEGNRLKKARTATEVVDGGGGGGGGSSYGLGEVSYGARSEVLYNFDPYVLGANITDDIGDADFTEVQGAFRQGKWKFMFNSWCSGYYAFDNKTLLADDLTDEDNTCQELGECSQCGANCASLDIDYTDWLFDLEDDPRELNNLANEHPEVVESLRRRVLEVVFQEFSNSSYESVNYGAYYIWRKFDYWMVPWWELEQGADDADDESDGL